MVCLASLAPAATAADATGFALLKRYLDGREPALPEGCVLDVELEAKELLTRFLPAGRAAVEEAYRGMRAELGRRPTPTELLHLLPSPPPAARYTTHVPVYDLTAAAGFWGPESVPEEIGWTEVPGVSLKPGMFVARVTGTSMEPLIPDGSWCLFRPCPAGSREGRIVLVQLGTDGAGENGGRFTVKKYHSEIKIGRHRRRLAARPHSAAAGESGV